MTMMKTRIVETTARPSVVHCNPLLLTCPVGSDAEVNVDATVVSWFDSLGRAVTFEVSVSSSDRKFIMLSLSRNVPGVFNEVRNSANLLLNQSFC